MSFCFPLSYSPILTKSFPINQLPYPFPQIPILINSFTFYLFLTCTHHDLNHQPLGLLPTVITT